MFALATLTLALGPQIADSDWPSPPTGALDEQWRVNDAADGPSEPLLEFTQVRFLKDGREGLGLAVDYRLLRPIPDRSEAVAAILVDAATDFYFPVRLDLSKPAGRLVFTLPPGVGHDGLSLIGLSRRAGGNRPIAVDKVIAPAPARKRRFAGQPRRHRFVRAVAGQGYAFDLRYAADGSLDATIVPGDYLELPAATGHGEPVGAAGPKENALDPQRLAAYINTYENQGRERREGLAPLVIQTRHNGRLDRPEPGRPLLLIHSVTVKPAGPRSTEFAVSAIRTDGQWDERRLPAGQPERVYTPVVEVQTNDGRRFVAARDPGKRLVTSRGVASAGVAIGVAADTIQTWTAYWVSYPAGSRPDKMRLKLRSNRFEPGERPRYAERYQTLAASSRRERASRQANADPKAVAKDMSAKDMSAKTKGDEGPVGAPASSAPKPRRIPQDIGYVAYAIERHHGGQARLGPPAEPKLEIVEVVPSTFPEVVQVYTAAADGQSTGPVEGRAAGRRWTLVCEHEIDGVRQADSATAGVMPYLSRGRHKTNMSLSVPYSDMSNVVLYWVSHPPIADLEADVPMEPISKRFVPKRSPAAAPMADARPPASEPEEASRKIDRRAGLGAAIVRRNYDGKFRPEPGKEERLNILRCVSQTDAGGGRTELVVTSRHLGKPTHLDPRMKDPANESWVWSLICEYSTTRTGRTIVSADELHGHRPYRGPIRTQIDIDGFGPDELFDVRLYWVGFSEEHSRNKSSDLGAARLRALSEEFVTRTIPIER